MTTDLSAAAETCHREERSNVTSIADIRMSGQAMERYREISRAKDRLLRPGLDFGQSYRNPDKKVLLKTGAEKLLAAFRIRPAYTVLDTSVQDYRHGFFSYDVKTGLFFENQVVGEGVGSCNTREGGYRDQDPFDTVNTVLKMAKKRSLIDATLSALGLSWEFTQDLDDAEDGFGDPRHGGDSRNAGLTVKDAVLAGVAFLEGMGLADDGKAFARTLTKGRFNVSELKDIPEDKAEELLQWLRSDELLAELRREGLVR